MGTIPAPDIFHDAAQIAQMPEQAYAQDVTLKGEQQRQRQVAQQMEVQRRQLADQDALTKTISQFNPAKHSLDDIPQMVTKNGGSGQAGLNAQAGLVQQRKNLTSLSDEQFAQEQKKADLIQGVHDAVSDAKPEEKQQVYSQGMLRLAQGGVDISKESPQYPGDDVFAQHLPAIRLHSAILAEAQKDRELTAQEQKGRFEAAQAAHQEFINSLTKNSKPGDFDAQVDQIYPPNDLQAGGPNRMTKALVNGALSRGDLEGAKQIIDQAFQSVQGLAKDIAVATNPQIQAGKEQLARVEAQERQRALQGDPAVAGQLLESGALTLADLKTRGTTPQFIEQSTLAAQKINPAYNPADEVIAESVAKSPTANQFFGSANSLIGKGGTLDQLEKLGKNIPQHDWPVLNSVDDWQKLARGKGPLAGYASTALGVADDYGKVMGGGNSSDHARDAALALFAHSASPDQRAQAVQATRDAVLSQRDSRIGNNQFLKRQYGTEVSKGLQSSGTLPKSLTAKEITAYAQAHNVSEEEVKRQAKAQGIQVP